ncbi:MAG: hypothetical protein HYT13_00030 [Candidatus Liptonbacteria bacterium]|nr:hypothetical protein [Candidatus Liptonbacteria bacterium]
MEQLIDWIGWFQARHPTIESVEIESLFSSIRIKMGRERYMGGVWHKKESQLETTPSEKEPKTPSQKQDVVVSELGSGALDETFFFMKYPWSVYKFRVSRASLSLLIGNQLTECVLEPIVARRSGKFFLGKTRDETGKKKRSLRSGDLVVANDRLGFIVYKERGKRFPSYEWVLAKTIGHLDIPQGVDWARVKEGDTLMLIAVTKSEKTVNPET